MRALFLSIVLSLICCAAVAQAKDLSQIKDLPQLKDQLQLNDQGYFSMPGLDVTVFSDIYPDGHQTGVTLIQHGTRVAANGDLRLEVSPGQWSPMPAGGEQKIDVKAQRISQQLSYPDPSKNRRGFNPIDYPDLNFSYRVNVTALGDNRVKVSVDLDKPLPPEWIGKVGFNLELFPGLLFGKSWLMDNSGGIFPQQPNGPLIQSGDDYLTAAMASGKTLVVAPETNLQRVSIHSETGQLQLWDGRGNHNNGWFIVREAIPAGASKNAIQWIIAPHVEKNWRYTPVLQVSQVGYGTGQQKRLVIEQDARDTRADKAQIYRLGDTGKSLVKTERVKPWGKFLRYEYMTLDFSDIKQPGLYQIYYRGAQSQVFRIGDDVLARNVWQPTLEYFLPVQMCHMRVNEKYRVWHGLDHQDDARMAPINYNHIDGYISGPSTLTQFKPGERVPGLNQGGWHDAGDYDLRVESQMGTVWLLAAMVEEFNLNLDSTLIDEQKKLVEIHQGDGKNDALQQIEHGLLSVLGGYKSLGRLYRGIISPTVRQYVLLGDGSVQTDNLPYNAKLTAGERKNDSSGDADDRWVFTEDNPNREAYVAAGLAAAARVLQSSNPTMARESLEAAEAIYQKAKDSIDQISAHTFALTELLRTTGKQQYLDELLSLQTSLAEKIDQTGWMLARVWPQLKNHAAFAQAITSAVKNYQAQLRERAQRESPYGVPYQPNIWGAGWTIQELGVHQYFFNQAWPQYVGTAAYENALNFILGVHPGENTASFASGVGAHSATVAYGVNRADWSYIPGGVVSGTALIRPDLPELKTWPFFWQQTEYVLGGGATNFMFLALAVDQLNSRHQQ